MSVDVTDAGDLWWANHYTRQVGGEAIESVTMAFGPNMAGLSVSFIVYHDPNGDGNAGDLVYLGQVDTAFPAFEDPIGANDFVTAVFASPIDVGPSFFIAGLILNAPDTGIRADITNGQNQAWVAATDVGGTFNILNPNAAETPPLNSGAFSGTPLDYIFMAEGVEGPGLNDVPEPVSMLTMAGGLACLAMLRRRRRVLDSSFTDDHAPASRLDAR